MALVAPMVILKISFQLILCIHQVETQDDLSQILAQKSVSVTSRSFQSRYAPDRFPEPSQTDFEQINDKLRGIPNNNLFLDHRFPIASIQKPENDITYNHPPEKRKLVIRRLRTRDVDDYFGHEVIDELREHLCNTSYVWRDYGSKYYPRFIMEGFCLSEIGTCCREKRVIPYFLLRWVCLEDEKCKWMKYKQHIVTKCSC
ncbi:Noggin-2 [Thelohanellus kitauei]|uniref:Noggin-2 n=1 Tax=Thelohanellus kitauei TaxID=669202 RepID=A0A0C2N1H2_THEKT|nr:Noggin-2 [Thelohanellus kitauei]